MLVLEGLVGLVELFSFFNITGWGIDLDYCDIEWFALETNRDYVAPVKYFATRIICTD